MTIQAEDIVNVSDMFGTKLSPRDIIIYCPGSKRSSELRIGIYISSTDNHRGDKKAIVKFMTDYGLGWDPKFASINCDIFSKRSFIIPDVEFRLDNKMIRNALRYMEDNPDFHQDYLNKN